MKGGLSKGIKLLALLVVLYLAWALVNNLNKPLDIDPRNFRVIPIDSYYSDAEEIAKEWKDDVYLSFVSLTFTLPSDDDEILFATYSFSSLSDPNSWINIMIVEDDSIQMKSHDGRDESDNPPTIKIDVTTIPIGSLDAIVIAYNNGGAEFINDHRGIEANSTVILKEANRSDRIDELIWRVVFSANRYDSMKFEIDPFTGEVLDSWRNDE